MWLRQRFLRRSVTRHPYPNSRCRHQPSWRLRRHRSAATSIAGEAPPPATCGPSPCLGHLLRPVEDHNHAHLASALSLPRLCHHRPASTDPAHSKAVLQTAQQETPAAPVKPQVRSSAPPMSYHRRPASEAAKLSLAADVATKARELAVRSTWALP